MSGGQNSELDLSAAIEKISEMFGGEGGQEKLGGILDALSGGTKPGGPAQGIAEDAADFEMMMKMGKAVSKMKSQEKSRETALLYALKPYLGESRREKTDSAVKIMGMIKAFSALKESGFDFGI